MGHSAKPLSPRGRGVGERGQSGKDRAQDSLFVGENIGVPEANYTPALAGQPAIARGVISAFVVLPPIRFDDQLRDGTGEVDDGAANLVLAAESPALEPFGSKQLPETLFRIGLVGP